MVRSLHERVRRLSHPSLVDKNLEVIKNMLRNNNYPDKLVNNIIHSTVTQRNQIAENIKYYRFPLIDGITGTVKAVLQNENSKVVFYNTNTVGQLFSATKDKTPLGQQSGCVYEIPCVNCDKVYIGQTKNYLKDRVKNHQSDCRPVNLAKKEKTALSGHHFQTGHNFDFANTRILDREKNLAKRAISEMIFIKRSSNSINLRTDTNNLSTIYSNIIANINC